jgi:secondary thiamine-phosphate synthase enzyme
MVWEQRVVTLRGKPRGFHLVTDEIVRQLPELRRVRVGLAHFFIRHTSASLTLNENADPDVRTDLESWWRRAAPDDAPYFRHTLEGADDMPAHIKAATVGAGLTVPITDGALNMGTWQGIYLGEHRARGGGRQIVVTVLGEE